MSNQREIILLSPFPFYSFSLFPFYSFSLLLLRFQGTDCATAFFKDLFLLVNLTADVFVLCIAASYRKCLSVIIAVGKKLFEVHLFMLK